VLFLLIYKPSGRWVPLTRIAEDLEAADGGVSIRIFPSASLFSAIAQYVPPMPAWTILQSGRSFSIWCRITTFTLML